MKEDIISVISLRNGIKAIDLALAVMDKVNPSKFIVEEFHKLVDELVRAGRIKELEYFTSDMPYRIKSIYFTGDTTLLNRGDNARTSQVIVDGESEGDSQFSHFKT